MRRTISFLIALLPLACGSRNDGTPEAPNPCPTSAAAVCDQQIVGGTLPETERAACEANELRTCSTNYYLRGYPAYVVPDCNGGSFERPLLNAELDLVLYRGPGVIDTKVVEQTHGLQRYYEPHALWFFTAQPSWSAPMRYAIDGSKEKLLAALKAKGINPYGSLSPDQEAIANQIVGDMLFAPLRGFLTTEAQPPAKHVNVVVLTRIANPGLDSLLGAEIAGLGLSPALFDVVTASDPSKNLYDLIGVGSFTPTLFVGSAITGKYTDSPDNLVAHEMGHALGLPHDNMYGNLMFQGSPLTCRTVLEPTQAGEIKLPHVISTKGVFLLAEMPRLVLSRLREPSP